VIEGGPRDGTRVAVDPAIPCERCATCRRGQRNLCPAVVFAGHGSRDGAMRELLAWPAQLLHPLPDALSDADGAMLEPLGVALHAFDLGHVRVGARVGVFGCGPIGLLLLQVARAAGAGQVVAADLLPHRREAAAAIGADEVLDAAASDVLGAADDAELDVTFEVGGTDGAVELALAAARPGGRVVLAGIPDDDRTSFTASLARRKGLTIAMARRMHETYPRATALVEQGLVDVRSLVTHRFPLPRATEAFETASARLGLKVVVHPDAGPRPDKLSAREWGGEDHPRG
jgi:L-iditol 2-dehydrogenase